MKEVCKVGHKKLQKKNFPWYSNLVMLKLKVKSDNFMQLFSIFEQALSREMCNHIHGCPHVQKY